MYGRSPIDLARPHPAEVPRRYSNRTTTAAVPGSDSGARTDRRGQL